MLPDGPCERTFAHSRIHATERDAAIDGLRAGMTWIEMRKSNTFTVHAWAQSIAKNPSTPLDEWAKFDESKDRVLGEYRGSSTIERFLDPNDEALLKDDYDAIDTSSKGLDPYYRFRIVNHKRFIVQ